MKRDSGWSAQVASSGIHTAGRTCEDMPLGLEQYAAMLDERGDPRPAGPVPLPFTRAKPHLPRMPEVRAVIFGGYGTLLWIDGGQLHFLNPDPTMRRIALDKTIQEFRMWQSMSRKPGEPAEYMAAMFQQVLDQQVLAAMNQKDFEPRIDRVWLGIFDRLGKKEYVYDVGQMGPPEEYAKKISYYYLRASQGVSAAASLGAALSGLKSRGVLLGIHAAGQCNTPVQIGRLLAEQSSQSRMGDSFDASLCLWSFEMGVRHGSERSFQLLMKAIQSRKLSPEQVLYVGSSIDAETAPVKRLGFRTAILLADRASAQVTQEQLAQATTRPDALITELAQLTRMLGT